MSRFVLPPLAAGDEQRKAPNAFALAANVAMLSSYPTVGRLEVERPVGSHRLEGELSFAADGRCLTSCCVADRNPDDWVKVARKPDGMPISFNDLVVEDACVRSCLLSDLREAGMPSDRVCQLVFAEVSPFQDRSIRPESRMPCS